MGAGALQQAEQKEREKPKEQKEQNPSYLNLRQEAFDFWRKRNHADEYNAQDYEEDRGWKRNYFIFRDNSDVYMSFHKDDKGTYRVSLVILFDIGVRKLIEGYEKYKGIIFAANYPTFFLLFEDFKRKNRDKVIKVGFMVRLKENGHATPIFYEQYRDVQGTIKCRLYNFDSAPDTEKDELKKPSPEVMLLNTAISRYRKEALFKDVRVYVGRTFRQADKWSCRAEALFFLTQALQLENLRDFVTNVKRVEVPNAFTFFACEPPPQCLLATQRSSAFAHLKEEFPLTHAVLSDHYTRYKTDITRWYNSGEKRFDVQNMFLVRDGLFNVERLRRVLAIDVSTAADRTAALVSHEKYTVETTAKVTDCFWKDVARLPANVKRKEELLRTFFELLDKCLNKENVQGTAVVIIRNNIRQWHLIAEQSDDMFNLLKYVGEVVDHRLTSVTGIFSVFKRSPYVGELYSILRQTKRIGALPSYTELEALGIINGRLAGLVAVEPDKFQEAAYQASGFPPQLLL